jgi:hypothetical protein
MAALNIGAYALGVLGPGNIAQNLGPIRQAGWTTINLGLFHIGRPDISGQQWGDIIFNSPDKVVSGGKYVYSPDWPNQLAQLKQGGSVTHLFASVGGGWPVEDFATIAKIYRNNGNSFAGTALQQNFATLRKTIPALDGVDMDCEDYYDPPSFLAFCQMLVEMGFALSFCPYTEQSFWVQALVKLQSQYPGKVRWWNLQTYDGGAGNDPQQWAQAINAALPGFVTQGYIFGSSEAGSGGNCPSDVQDTLSGFAGEPALGGGFIWNLDQVIQPNGACPGATQTDYVKAIIAGCTAKQMAPA